MRASLEPAIQQQGAKLSAATVADSMALTTARRVAARLGYGLPIVVFAALALVLSWGLNRDPRTIPSVLIGQPVPRFALPAVKGRVLDLSNADLVGQVSLVNVFASWCVECRVEHPLLLRLRDDAVVPIHGLNYKDAPNDAAKWLSTFGDPYTRTGADLHGRGAIDWGVYGVPETFVISTDGRIAYKQIGPVTPDTLQETILPLIRRLQQQ